MSDSIQALLVLSHGVLPTDEVVQFANSTHSEEELVTVWIDQKKWQAHGKPHNLHVTLKPYADGEGNDA